MTTIKNYNSNNPLSSYVLGDVYSFYLRSNNMSNLATLKTKDAKREDIKQYKKALRTAVKENPQCKTSIGRYDSDFTRAIGVVVDTYKPSCPTACEIITVMFRASKTKFVLNKYAVGAQFSNHTWTHDVVPAAVINLTAD
jgi:hypothetical protein